MILKHAEYRIRVICQSVLPNTPQFLLNGPIYNRINYDYFFLFFSYVSFQQYFVFAVKNETNNALDMFFTVGFNFCDQIVFFQNPKSGFTITVLI